MCDPSHFKDKVILTFVFEYQNLYLDHFKQYVFAAGLLNIYQSDVLQITEF